MKLLCILFAIFYAGNIYAISDEDKVVFDSLIRSGDNYFQKNENMYAFNEYKKAVELNKESVSAHYRLGRVYGFLNPKEQFCDREYALALYLFMKDYPDLESIDINKLRKTFELPINPKEKNINPIEYIKRDIDKDNKDELFILMKRGVRSYVLFVCYFYEFYPKVVHLTTFYEGVSGKNKIEFKDIIANNKEEIIVYNNTKDFLNIGIFRKNNKNKYVTILNQAGLFNGRYLFSKQAGGRPFTIEIYENLLKGPVFTDETGPYVSQKTLYVWNSEKYEEYYTETIENYEYCLNNFLEALMLKGDFYEAYKYIKPSLFLRDLKKEGDIIPFVTYMRQSEYSALLAEEGASKYAGKVKTHVFSEYNTSGGWQEEKAPVNKIFFTKEDVKKIKLIIDNNIFIVDMIYSGGWKISRLKRADLNTKGGWS
jgi:hypothetical protein